MCWWRSGTARRSTARTTCVMRTASSSCARRKRSKRCSLTVQMLSLILWSSLSGAVGSISRGIWGIGSPTSTEPSARPPPGRSPSCAARGSKSAIRSTPCIAARRSGGSPTSRGSSVSSVVCYLLGLSHIDPVATRLFIGRFLNETLASVPDIDLDFPREIREELIRRVYTRYGHEHVGLVCSFPTYRLRSTVREIGKALDLPPGEIEQVAKLADRRSGGLADELDQLPGFAGRRSAPLWKELCQLAEEIAGLPRHISQHVGGMVISSRPLVEIVPLER